MTKLLERNKAKDEILAGYKSKIAASEKEQKQTKRTRPHAPKYAAYYQALKQRQQGNVLQRNRFGLHQQKGIQSKQQQLRPRPRLPSTPISTSSAVSIMLYTSIMQ